MLLGYDKNGEIKFIFTDEKYLDKRFPNNSAKISDFWKVKKHGLKELHIPLAMVKDFDDVKKYKVVEEKLVRKTEEEYSRIKRNRDKKPVYTKQGLFVKSKTSKGLKANGKIKHIKPKINLVE